MERWFEALARWEGVEMEAEEVVAGPAARAELHGTKSRPSFKWPSLLPQT
jgi:hypothetical protein